MKMNIDVTALQKDLRALGIALMVASTVSGFLQQEIPTAVAIAGWFIGLSLWLAGLIRKED